MEGWQARGSESLPWPGIYCGRSLVCGRHRVLPGGGRTPAYAPTTPVSVSGMGKEVSGPQGLKALATRSVVAESLLLGPPQVTGFWGAHQTPTVAPVQAWTVIGLWSDSSGTSTSFVLGPFFLLQIQQRCSSNVTRHSPFPGRAMSLPCTPGPPGSSSSILSRAPVPLLCET